METHASTFFAAAGIEFCIMNEERWRRSLNSQIFPQPFITALGSTLLLMETGFKLHGRCCDGFSYSRIMWLSWLQIRHHVSDKGVLISCKSGRCMRLSTLNPRSPSTGVELVIRSRVWSSNTIGQQSNSWPVISAWPDITYISKESIRSASFCEVHVSMSRGLAWTLINQSGHTRLMLFLRHLNGQHIEGRKSIFISSGLRGFWSS